MIVQEYYTVGERQFVRTYSDANRYVVGGVPEGEYTEANDPAEFGRTYVEGRPIDVDGDPAAATEEDYIQVLDDLGVRLS